MGKMLSPKLRELSHDAEDEGQVLAHQCPACGTRHYVHVTKPNHCGAKWSWNGDVNRPTFSPSVNINHGECHYVLTDGRITYTADCRHDLRGMTVDLPDLKGY